MIKRVLLVCASLLAVLIALLLYRQFQSGDITPPLEEPAVVENTAPSGESAEQPETLEIEAGQVGIGVIEKPHFVTKDSDGKVVREFGFARRTSGDGGTFEIVEPWMTFYGENQQVIRITAAKGWLPMEGSITENQLPQRGRLEGGVRIELLRGREQGRKELSIELDHIDFELEFSQAHSDGEIVVEAEAFGMRGKGLTFQYDQLHHRLQEMEIREITTIDILQDYFDVLETGKANKQDSRNGDDRERSWAGVETQEDVRDTYQIQLGDNVRVMMGDDTLYADSLTILADMDKESLNREGDDPYARQRSSDNAESSELAAAQRDEGTISEGDEGKGQWVTVRCDGPLRVMLIPTSELAAADKRLEFRAKGDPLRLRRGEQDNVLLAKEMYYNVGKGVFDLIGDEKQAVRIVQPASMDVIARQVRFNQDDSRIELTGPGHIHHQGKDKRPVAVDFNAGMAIDLEEGEAAAGDGDDLLGQWMAKEIRFDGGLTARQGENWLTASNGVLALRHNGKNPVLAHAELTGDVSGSNDSATFSGEQVVLDFADDGDNQLKSLYAQGDIEAAQEPYIFRAADYVSVTFASADEGKKRDKGEGDDIEQMFGQGRWEDVKAGGAEGGIELIDHVQGYHIVGDKVEGSAVSGIWKIHGEPASVSGLRQEQRLEGAIIELDQERQVVSIPGQGAMTFVSEHNLTGQVLDRPVPLHLSWADGADYGLKSREITLRDVSADITETEDGREREHRLHCETMTVKVTGSGSAESAGAEGDNEGNTEGAVFHSSDTLEQLTTVGNPVQIVSTQRHTGSGTPLSRMELQCPTLTFDNVGQELFSQGEGWVEVVQYEGHEAGAGEPGLGRTVSGKEPSYSLIRFTEGFTYTAEGGQLRFPGATSLDYIPLDQNASIVPDSMIQVEGMVRMNCGEMAIGIESDEGYGAEGPAVENTMPMTLGRLEARKNVFCETISQGQSYIFSADYARYDREKQLLEFRGDERLPVRFNLMQFSWVLFEMNSGRFEAHPLGESQLVELP